MPDTDHSECYCKRDFLDR